MAAFLFSLNLLLPLLGSIVAAASIPNFTSGISARPFDNLAESSPAVPHAAPTAMAAPSPLSLGGSAAQNWSPYAPSIFTDGFVDLTLPADGLPIAALPNFTVNQTGNLSLLFNGTWNPAPGTSTDRAWAMLIAVLAGNASTQAIASNTTTRLTLTAAQLPAAFFFALPSPVNFSSGASTAQVKATLPSGAVLRVNLTTANAGMNLSAAKGAAPIAAQSVWFNASGNYTSGAVLSGLQSLTVVVPTNGIAPFEVRADRISQWTGPGNFAGARFMLLQNSTGGGTGTMRLTLWTRGSPESGLFMNVSVAPANATRAGDITLTGQVGNRALADSTNWSVNQTAVLAPNHDFENCTNLLRLQNGSWRLFCTFVETDINMTVTQGVDSAFSPDGVTWVWEPGVRYQLCAGAHTIDNVAIVRFIDGSLRMWYAGQSATNCGGGGAQSHFQTAVSSDEGATWTFGASFGNNINGQVSLTFTASTQGWIRWYMLVSGYPMFSFLFDGEVPASTNITFDGWNLTADNPRTVYLLTDGTYKMYFGTTSVYSSTSLNGLNWTAPQLELSNWSGDIAAGPLLDNGDGALRMLLYSQNSGLFIATLGGTTTTVPTLGAKLTLSDGRAIGPAAVLPNSSGAFSGSATVPAGALLGRFRIGVSAWFGGASPEGLVLNRVPAWTGPATLTATEDVPLVLDVLGAVADEDEVDTVSFNASSPFGSFDGANLTLLYPDGVLTDAVVVSFNDSLDVGGFLIPVAITAVDDPPTIALNSSYDVLEDHWSPVDFLGSYADEETSASLLNLSTNATGASVSGSVISFNYSTDGDRAVSVSVSDGNHTVTATTTLHVLPVDDAPVLALDPTYYGQEDSLLTLDFGPAAFDEDTPRDQLLLATDLVGANVSGLTVTVYHDLPGAIPFNVTVFDGTSAVRAASLLVVQQRNDPPRLNLSSTYEGDEDAPIVIDLTPYVSDEDNPLSSLYLVTDLPGATVSGLTISLTVHQPGTLAFHVTVSDGTDSVTGSSQLIVRAVNDAPRWLALPAVEAVEETALTLDLSPYATDEDNLTSELSFTSSSPYAQVSGALLRFEYPEGVLADNVTLTVSDGLLGAQTTLVVRVTAVNDLPVLIGQPPGEIGAASVVEYNFSGTDVETPAQLVFSVESPVPWITISGSGTLDMAPAVGAHGRFAYNVSLSDGQGGMTTRAFLVKVGNLPPQILNISLNAVPNVLFTTRVVVFDPDDDPVAVQVFPEARAASMEFNRTTGEIAWTPPFTAPPGVKVDVLVNVTVQASDGLAVSTRTFAIRVRDPPNEAPFFTGNFPLVQGHNGEVTQLTLFDYVRDADDPASNLTWRIEGTLDGAVALWTLDPDLGTLIIVFKGQGSGTLTVTVRDPSGVTATQPLRVETLPGAAVPAGSPSGFPWWILLVLGAGAAGAAVYARRRAALRAEMQALAPVAAPSSQNYLVESVFLLTRGGRPVYARGGIGADSQDDPDVLGAMLMAVQEFVRDAFKAGGTASRMSYGDGSVLLERGSHVTLAVILFGEPGQALGDLMVEVVGQVERRFAGVIEDWDGDRAGLDGLEEILAPLWVTSGMLTRADVVAAMRSAEVQMLSAVEFFQGYVRVRLGIVNNTASVINGVIVDLDFNSDVLRLVRTEPEVYKTSGARVVLGSVGVGEKVALSYYLDPQICTSSSILGSCVYKDSAGKQHVVEMKSRNAEVVCPIFFTKEQANSALLKRLVETELNLYDARAYKLRPGIADADLARIFGEMKSAVLAHDVQLVRDFEGRRPYVAEAWFYGRTQAKGRQMVIRAAVSPAKGRIEFFVASTAMGPITGLLAELHHTFTRSMGSRVATLGLEPLFDERLKAEFTNRNAVSHMLEGEALPGESEPEG